MAQTNSMSRLAGTTGSLAALIGMLIFFIGVFGFAPKSFVFVGIALIVVSLIAYSVQEFGPRR